MTADPFAGHDPSEFNTPDLPSLKTKKVGDYWVGEVTHVGEVFQSPGFAEKPPEDTFAVTVKLKAVNLTTVPEDEAFPYTPPNAGEEAIWYVKVGKHSEKILQAALKRAGVDSLSVGDELAVKFMEKVKTDKPYPFHKHAAIVKPSPKVDRNDPFSGGNQAPF